MKPFCFTFDVHPKAVYLLSEIQSFCKNDQNLISDWTSNSDVIILNDNNSVLSLKVEQPLDNYLESITELERKLFENEL